MKVQEIYNMTAQLGFEDTLENNERFFGALNRAILECNRIRPATAICRIEHFPLENKINEDTKTAKRVRKGEAVYFYASDVVSYYFEADGDSNAVVKVECEDSTQPTGWRTLFTVTVANTGKGFNKYRGFILDGAEEVSGLIRIVFSGDYSYMVRNVAMYAEKRSSVASDIPEYGNYTRYDLKTLTTDFLSFCSPPIFDTEENRTLSADYFRLENNDTVLFPQSIYGTFDIKYRRRVNAIASPVDMTAVDVDLDDEIAMIMPNLIAAYLYAEDSPSLADNYMALFYRQEAIIRNIDININPVIMRDTKGW